MLTDKQKQAARMFYNCERIGDIALAVGVHRTTVWRWRKKRSFKQELSRLAWNDERRLQRRIQRAERKREEYWTKRLADAEKKLQETAENGRPRDMDRAWKEREICLFRGYSWAEVEDMLWRNKPLKPKIPRAKKTATKTG